jgi:hypothetical protein
LDSLKKTEQHQNRSSGSPQLGRSGGALRMEIAAFETPPKQMKIAVFWMPHHMEIAASDQMKIAVFETPPDQNISNTRNNKYSPLRSPEGNRIGIFIVLHVALSLFPKRRPFTTVLHDAVHLHATVEGGKSGHMHRSHNELLHEPSARAARAVGTSCTSTSRMLSIFCCCVAC